jgi:hypothetical protein
MSPAANPSLPIMTAQASDVLRYADEFHSIGKVIEFRFDYGVLRGTQDRSADMAAIREANAGKDPDALGKPITPHGIAEWIGRRFDLGY